MALPNPEQPVVEQPVNGMDALQQERAKLYQIQADLMKQIEERSKPDPSAFWAAMARGFGNPATPSFAGGAAGFAGNLQAAQEEERKRAIETAQMRMQLAQAQLAMKRSDVIGQALFGEPPKQEPEANVAIGSVAQAAGVSPNVARVMPPDLKKAVMLQWMQGDEKGAIDTMAKFALENAKTPDQMKIQQWNISQFPPSLRPFIQQFIANNAIFGSAIDRTKAFTEIDKLVDDGVISSKQGDIYKNSLSPDILTKPIGTYSATATPAEPAAPPAPAPAAKPAATSTPAGFPRVGAEEQRQRDADRTKILSKELDQERQKLAAATTPDQRRTAEQNIASIQREMGVKPPVAQPTKREREIESENIKQLQEARNKAATEERNKAYASSNEAPQNRNIAAEVSSLVSKSPNMFGVFEKPNFGSAIGGVIENAVNVGRFNVGMPGIRSAISKLGARNQEDLDNLQKVGFLAVNTSLGLAAAAKGSVSNFERELFQQASLSTHDTPNVLLYKADLLKARANFANTLWNDFRDFEKANPSKNFTDYQDSRGKDLVSRYEAQLARIRDHYAR